MTVKEKIPEVATAGFVHENIASYGRKTVEDRAVPDFRDGMKPVHRRVLWAANQMNLNNFTKSAKLVAETMGNYHPHGDQAIYGAVVSMVNWPATPFKGQGNFGNMVDDDPPAAMRYCVTGDTMVHTDHGLIPVKNLKRAQAQLGTGIRKEYLTQSLNGDMMPVSNWIYSGKHRTRKIQTNAGFELACTANHPLLVVTPEWEIEWREAGDIQPGDYVCINRRNEKIDYKKTEMSHAAAKLLGYLVSDGYSGKNDVQFSSAYKSVSDDFKAILAELGLEKFGDYLKAPSSYGKRTHRQISITDKRFRAELETMGLYQGTSYDRVVPDAIWTTSRMNQRAFLATYFEGDGSISIAEKNSVQIAAHSVSRKLLKQIKLLMWTHFDIMTSPIFSDGKQGGYRMFVSGAESIARFLDDIGFISKRKLKIMEVARECLENISSKSGNSKIDVIPYAGDYGVHVTRRKCFEHIDRYNHLSQEDLDKLYTLLKSNYLFAKVTENKRGKKRKVYDLTVPKTHAFTANGFVAHNTELKLNEFAKKILLNPEYLECVPMHANYDGTATQPLYLPALLPMILMTGDQGIAVGVSVKYPSFSAKSVAKVVEQGLRGKKLTTRMCAKTLEFDHGVYGGEAVFDTDDGFQNMFGLSKSRIEFRPSWNIAAGAIHVTSSCPGLEHLLPNAMEKMAMDPAVQSMQNRSGETVEYIVTFKSSVPQGERRALAEKMVQKYLKRAVTYSIAGTKRKISDPNSDEPAADFFFASPIDILERWIEWRIKLEHRMLGLRIKKLRTQLHRTKIMMLAAQHFVELAKEITRKSDVDLNVRIAKLMVRVAKLDDFTTADADMILSMSLRSLSNLELTALEKKKSELIKSINENKNRRAEPAQSAADATKALLQTL